MTVAAIFGGFDMIMRAYQEYLAMDAPGLSVFLRDSLAYKPVLGAPLFDQGPGDIASFAAIYEIIHKLNQLLLIGRFFGTQEELGTSCILNAFTGDAVGIARTSIEDTPASDATFYRLHSALRALLQAYLQSITAKEGVHCARILFGLLFELCWTEAVSLYELGSAIVALTSDDTLYVKCLDVP
jgi:hypothetical protein